MTDGDADVDGETTDETETVADTGGPGDAGETVADVTEYTTGRRTISGRIQIVWGAGVVVTALVVGAIATVVVEATARLPLVVGPAVGVLIVAVGLPWVHLRYRVWGYELRDDSLYLERGVVTHVKSIVPYVRIQHVDTQRGPLERSLGLSTLVVYTAGTRGADVSVPGLTPEEARDLQRRVKELAIEAEGGDAV